MRTVAKILTLAGVIGGGYLVADKIASGSWIWEKNANARLLQTQAQQSYLNGVIQRRVQEQLMQQTKAKENEVLHGRYHGQGNGLSWTKPTKNYSMATF